MCVERSGEVVAPEVVRVFKPDHEHDDRVSSVGIDLPGALAEGKLQKFFQKLLREKGTDLYRSKGILSIEGNDRRVVFQGVHMLLETSQGPAWEDEPRQAPTGATGIGVSSVSSSALGADHRASSATALHSSAEPRSPG